MRKVNEMFAVVKPIFIRYDRDIQKQWLSYVRFIRDIQKREREREKQNNTNNNADRDVDMDDNKSDGE